MSTPLRSLPDGHLLLTVAEAAAALGATRRTVEVHVANGRIPCVRTPGGRPRIPNEAVRRLRVELGIDAGPAREAGPR